MTEIKLPVKNESIITVYNGQNSCYAIILLKLVLCNCKCEKKMVLRKIHHDMGIWDDEFMNDRT